MLGHNQLSSAVEEIKQHHAELDLLVSQAEDRAKAIGEVLLAIQPVLKEVKISLTDFVKELPFGKTAAYEYISIAKGKKTWAELHQRKNPEVENSATAENYSELLDGDRQRLRWIEAVAVLNNVELEFQNHKHLSYVLNKPEALLYDSYNLGFFGLCAVSALEHIKEEGISRGDIKGVKVVINQQKVISEALNMSLDETLLLSELVFNMNANLEGLEAGGHTSNHPLSSAYLEFFDGSGAAEDWCSEAMYEDAMHYLEDILGDSEAANELRERKNQRPPFWSLALRAAKVLEGRITKPFPVD